MRINRLWLKFAAVSALTAIVAVLVAALLVRNAASSDFGRYLRNVRGMGQMMGGLGGMMGPSETQFLHSISNSLWIAAVIAVVIGAVVAVLFSRQVTAPLSRLSAAASRVRQGDLSQRVVSTSGDEVGLLTDTFNGMVDSLGQNQEARRKLMADLAHEMGTPLAVLQSNLEGMLDGIVEPSATTISSLHQEALLLSRLVSDLRTLSQAEAGRLSLAIVPGDPAAVVHSVVDATEPEAKRKGVSLSFYAESGLPPAMMDNDRVSQVMVNLLSNALRYTSSGGSIKVSVVAGEKTAAANSVTVSVKDTGQGIASNDLPHIFNHYYRGAQPAETRADGSGIGLAVVKELVEAHKGKVWVESKEGEGSTFYFTLPTAAPARTLAQING